MKQRVMALSGGLVALLCAGEAMACGGMFCSSQAQPVDQAAERIVFAVDKEQGTVEAHVQITYEGSAKDFAWVVPVKGVPELFPSVDDIFVALSPRTMPLWQLGFSTEGTCKGQNGGMVPLAMGATDDMAMADSGTWETGGEPGRGARAIDSGAVGPFDYAIVQARSAQALVDWLDDPDGDGDTSDAYFIPDSFQDAAAPYVTDGHNFLALRLQKDKDAGDLVPLGMRYDGDEASIPLQLTAIAATPDMRLQPYVLGDGRAVPVNYLHVEVNELAVDWMNAGNNYPDVITRAANEAGGQAFATDFSGSTSAFAGVFWQEGMYRPGVVAYTGHPFDLVDSVRFDASIPISNGTVPVLQRYIPIPDIVLQDGVTAVEFFQCMECYTTRDAYQEIDGTPLSEALAEEWVGAMRNAQELFDRHPTITRLTSSISAEEMTVDPIFAINPDMDGVVQIRTAQFITMCNPSVELSDAPRKLLLPDGREMLFPADYANNPSTFDFEGWIGDVGDHAAQTIAQTGRNGAAEVRVDNTAAIDEALKAHNSMAVGELGCASGCNQGSGAAFGWLGLGLGLAGLRRRRR